MKDNPFTVQEQATIICQYRGIGITSKLQAFYLPTSEALRSPKPQFTILQPLLASASTRIVNKVPTLAGDANMSNTHSPFHNKQ